MYTTITTDTNKAADIIRDGRVVAFPTGTSYGLAADCLQGFALQRVRNLKQRPEEKTFTIFMAEDAWSRYLNLTELEHRMLEAMQGQSLTLLVQPKQQLQHLAQDGRIGLRVIDHPLMNALANAVDVPMTATSANRAGDQPCRTPKCIARAFPGKLPESDIDEVDPKGATNTTYNLSLGCILDGGELSTTQSSTIARIADEGIEIIRSGSLDQATLAAAL